MKECGYSITFLGRCSERPGGCLFLENEGLEGGVVDPQKIKSLYAKKDTMILQAALSTLKSGSGRKECRAKEQIISALSELLRERESS